MYRANQTLSVQYMGPLPYSSHSEQWHNIINAVAIGYGPAAG